MAGTRRGGPGRNWAEVPRVAIGWLVAAALSALLGWAVQAVLADHGGAGVGRRPDHDDSRPAG